MDSQQNSCIIENTRNMNRNFSTEVCESVKNMHNSDLDSKINFNVHKSHSREKIVNVDSQISVLFSAIRQKANNLIAAKGGPQINQKGSEKMQSEVDADNCSIIIQKHSEKHTKTSMRYTMAYKGQKIRTTNTFKKNYHNKTHGNIINSNIRPQSACMLNKINSRSNIIDSRLRENGINIDLQRNIFEKFRVRKRKYRKIDKTRFGYKPQRIFSKRVENKNKQPNLSATYSRKQRIMSAAYQNRRFNENLKEK